MKHINIILSLLIVLFVNVVMTTAQTVGTVNFIQNPHFSDSLKFYTTEYPMTTNPVYPEGTYVITDNPQKSMYKYYSHSDHTQDEAKLMFFVNSGRFDSDSGYVLSQTVRNLSKYGRYKVSFWVAPNTNRNIARLRILFNDKIYEDSLTIKYNGDGVWDEYSYYLDTLFTDTFNFKIYTLSKQQFGNDFALDDFSLNRICDEQFNFIDTIRKCNSDAATYKIEFDNEAINYEIKWLSTNFINIDNPLEPIFTNPESQYFYFNINDIKYGCSYKDSIYVENYSEIPVNEITTNNMGVLCPCSSTTLSVPKGYKYLWNTSETTNEIEIKKAGKYWVNISSAENCQKYLEIEIKDVTPKIDISIDSISAKIGENIIVPIKYMISNIKELSNCQNLQLSVKLLYNPYLFLPDEIKKYRIYKDDTTEILKIDLPIKAEENQFDIKGIALFGDAECTAFNITPGDDCSDIYNINFTDGALCITDICKEPSIRLISKNEDKYSVEINADNNQLSIKYKFPQVNGNYIEIYNTLGERLFIIEIENSKEGEKVIKNVAIGSGVYVFKWQNSTNVAIRKFIKK